MALNGNKKKLEENAYVTQHHFLTSKKFLNTEYTPKQTHSYDNNELLRKYSMINELKSISKHSNKTGVALVHDKNRKDNSSEYSVEKDQILGKQKISDPYNSSSKYLNMNQETVFSSSSQHGSSDLLLRETELELKKLQKKKANLALVANKMIYKLAFDENITDQSESECGEADDISKTDKLKCPKSCKSLHPTPSYSEIVVHEADSGSEAGSEDIELLPHRYESESTQKCDKHIYVNNLSLAVELLRTRENLPYDAEFKRIIDDGLEKQDKKCLQNEIGIIPTSTKMGKLQTENNNVEHQHNNSSSSFPEEMNQNGEDHIGVQSEISNDEPEEETKGSEAEEQNFENINTNASQQYTKYVQSCAHQRFNIFLPRTTSIVNPCLCCTIM